MGQQKLKTVAGWFDAPIFPEEEDKTRSAFLLNTLLNTFIIALPVIFTGILLGGMKPATMIISSALTIVWILVIGLRFLMLNGKVSAAGMALVCIIFLLTTFSIYNLGTIRAPATSFYILVIIMAGLIVSRRAILWTAGISAAMIVILVMAEIQGLLPKPDLAITITQAVTFIVAMSIVSVLLFLAVKSIDDAMSRARRELLVRKQTEEILGLTNSRLGILHEIDRSLLADHAPREIAYNALAKIRQLIPCPRASVTLFDLERKEASFLTAHFDEKFELPSTPLGFEEFGQRVIDTLLENKPWLSEDVRKDPQVTEFDLRLSQRENIQAWLSVPLMVKGELIGALNLGRPAGNPFVQEDTVIAHDIANQLAIALHQAKLYDALKKELDERKRLIAQLEASNAELERFTYTVSHDLRSPLVTIKGFLGMLSRDIKDGNPEKIQSDFQRIGGAADKMDALLSDLLELSRIGRLVNPPEEVDSARLIQDALDSVDGRLRSKNVTVSIMPDLPSLYGDRVRLREVFENLIDNAAKYMGNQTVPMIEIGAQTQDGAYVFYVKDNGMGIDPAYQTRIFTLFEKLNPTFEGTGIGLTLVKRIVETHGGRIWVESQGEGKGATFWFTLPVK